MPRAGAWGATAAPAAPTLPSMQSSAETSLAYGDPPRATVIPAVPRPRYAPDTAVPAASGAVRLTQAEKDLPPPLNDSEPHEGPSINERLNIPRELPGAKTPPIPMVPYEHENLEARQALVRKLFPELPPAWELGPLESRPEKLGQPDYELTEQDHLWELGLSRLRPGQRPTTLDDLQRLAADSSPLIIQARADIISYRGTAIQAGTHPNPTFGYESDTVGSSKTRDYQGAYISQVIKTMNKLGLQRMVANMDHLNSQLALQRTRIEVSSQVKADYYSVLVAEQNVIISAALVRFTQRVLTLQTEMLSSSGKTVPYEPAQLRTLVEAARATLVAAQNSYVASWKKLAATVGVPDLPPSQLAGEANAPPPKINYQDALQRMWSVHPDVLAGRNMIAQARYQLRLDRIKPIPDVYVYGTFQKDFTTPGFQNVSYNTQLGVPLPIFDRNRGAIINAEGDLMRADQQVFRMQLDLQRQLAQVFGDYETNRSNVQRYREMILPDATRAYRGVYGRYNQMAGDVLTVTDIAFAQQQLATFIATYINYLNGQWQSVADLANLLQIDNFNDLYDIRNAPVEPLPNRTPPKQKGGH